jgi:hypothetical protein
MIRKFGAIISTFGATVLVVALLISFFSAPLIESSDLKSYIITDFYTITAMSIWQPADTLVAVNQTITNYLGFYNLTYNQTSHEIHYTQFDAWVLNYTTNQVYQNENASYAIQWAIDHSDLLEFQGGNYTLTQTLFLDSNTTFDGGGARFTVSENFNGTNVIHANDGSRITIRNVWLDCTDWDDFQNDETKTGIKIDG